jgi:prephenate dehydrogenase
MIGGVRIAILGFGLIGGSIARALRIPGAATTLGEPFELVAWSRRPDGPSAALGAGIVDDAPTDLAAAVDGADLIVLAAPPLVSIALVDELAGGLRGAVGRDATVTDVSSTKRMIGEAADSAGVRFVGGHPMAGREASGFGAATPDLFLDRPWIICTGRHATAGDADRVVALARACGANPIRMDPETHDRLAAAVSHVPLIVSAALVEAITADPAWPEARGLAAGGWRSMTRLADGDPTMGAGIAVTNASAIAAGLREVRAALEDWIAALETDPDPGVLEAKLRTARERVRS